MASLTLLQLKEQVRDLMRDNANTSLIDGTGDDANSYSDAQVKDAINYAIRIFNERTNASFTETSLTVDVNGLAPLPEDCIKIEDVLFAHKTLTETLAPLGLCHVLILMLPRDRIDIGEGPIRHDALNITGDFNSIHVEVTCRGIS